MFDSNDKRIAEGCIKPLSAALLAVYNPRLYVHKLNYLVGPPCFLFDSSSGVLTEGKSEPAGRGRDLCRALCCEERMWTRQMKCAGAGAVCLV